MEQLTKNQAVATSQEAVRHQNEPQLRDENAHNDKYVHGVVNLTYQAQLLRYAVHADIDVERIKRDENDEVSSDCMSGFDAVLYHVRSLRLYALFDKDNW